MASIKMVFVKEKSNQQWNQQRYSFYLGGDSLLESNYSLTSHSQLQLNRTLKKREI